MKSIQYAILSALFCSLVAGTACNKITEKANLESLSNPASLIKHTLLTITDTPTVYCYVAVNINQHVDNPGDSTFLVSAGGAFTDSATGNLLKMTSVAINSRVLTPSSDSSFDFSYTDSSGSIPAEGEALAGTNVVIKLTGISAADTVSQAIYMPKNLLTHTSDWPKTYGSIYLGGNLNLKWVEDSSTDTKQVYIQLAYNSILSQMVNSSYPSSMSNLAYSEYDNGAYTVSETNLSNTYQNQMYIQIGMARGTQRTVVLPVSHRQVVLWTMNTLVTTPLQVFWSM